MPLPDQEAEIARALAAMDLHPGPAELRKLAATPVRAQVARLLDTPVAPEAHNAAVFVCPDPQDGGTP